MELGRTTRTQYEKLKDLGFPINTTSKNPTPTLAFTTKWLREIKRLHIEVSLGHDENAHWYDAYVYPIKHDYDYDPINTGANVDEDDLCGDTHDEAESKGIDYAINLLTRQKMVTGLDSIDKLLENGISSKELFVIGGPVSVGKTSNLIRTMVEAARDTRFTSLEEMNCPSCSSVTAHELRDNVSNSDGGELWTCILCKTQLH